MKILIAFATGDGQTGRVAQRMADLISGAGHALVLANLMVGPQPDSGDFDFTLVAAPVRYGKHHRAALAFCTANREALFARPSAFVSVSLSAARSRPGARREVAKALSHFIKTTAWVPTRIFAVAGALLYTRYSPFLRRVMRFFARLADRETDASRDYEYTDWPSVDAFTRELLASLPLPAQKAPALSSALESALLAPAAPQRLPDAYQEAPRPPAIHS